MTTIMEKPAASSQRCRPCGRWSAAGLCAVSCLAACSIVYVVVHCVQYQRTGGSPQWVVQLATDPAPLPAITICNKNEVRVDRFTRRDIVNVGDWYLGVNRNNTDISDSAKNRLPVDVVRRVRGMLAQDVSPDQDTRPYDLTEFIARVGHQQDTIISACFWGATPCPDVNIRWTHNLAYPFGNCYTLDISAATVAGVDLAGVGKRLKIHFNAESVVRNEYSRPGVPGPILVVHQPGDVPYLHDAYGHPYEELSTGDIALVRIRKVTEIKRSSGDVDQCATSGVDQQPATTAPYTMNRCRLACESERFLSENGCQYYDHPTYQAGTPMCKVSPYTDRVAQGIISECARACREAPRVPCTQLVYDYSVHTLDHEYHGMLRERNLSVINVSGMQEPVVYEVWTEVSEGGSVVTGWVLYWLATVMCSACAAILVTALCSKPPTKHYLSVTGTT